MNYIDANFERRLRFVLDDIWQALPAEPDINCQIAMLNAARALISLSGFFAKKDK